MVLIVSPLRLLPEVIAARAPSHILSLLPPEEMIDTPAGFALERHLRIGCHDISIPMDGLIAPDAFRAECGRHGLTASLQSRALGHVMRFVAHKHVTHKGREEI